MRTDLMALTRESLALLANPGLVKRAQKELEAGTGPRLSEEADGTLIAQARDGATTRLPPHTPLNQALCSCGSVAVCRHRVAAVLAYLQAAAPAAQTPAAWHPGDFDDAALQAHCGNAAWARAQALVRGSLVVTTRPGNPPVACLPMATVQFLSAHSLTYARCDCALRFACEHVVLAVWAFRRCRAGGLLELGCPNNAGFASALTQAHSTLQAVAARGLTKPSMAPLLNDTRAHMERAGLVWLADAFADLEQQSEAYHRQSALFASRTCSALVAEIGARIRAARQPTRLPPHWILGAHEPQESVTGALQLTGLGTRILADGARRIALVYFAERHSGSVLVLRKTWQFASAAAARNGPALGAMFASARLSLSALSQGETIARGAKRRANGHLDLQAARGMRATQLPSTLPWADLPSGIGIEDLAAHAAAEAARPPRLLRPRRMGDDVHVVTLGAVNAVTYHPAHQALTAYVEDAAGHPFTLRLTHRTATPGALDALRAALDNRPRRVSGILQRGRAGWDMQPLAIAGEAMLVPDLAAAPQQQEDAPLLSHQETPDDLEELLQELGLWIDRGIQKGCATVQAASRALAERLDAAAMPQVGAGVRQAGTGCVNALLDVAVLHALMQEAG